MKLIAELDGRGYLIGTRRGRPKKSDLVLPDKCDLPTDGSYRWDGQQFHPPGHGHPTISSKPPISAEAVLFRVVSHLRNDLPESAGRWADWYKANLKRRDDEVAQAARRKGGR